MARVTITREEAEDGLLPDVCALTGEPTRSRILRTFGWAPAWILFTLPFLRRITLILWLVNRRQMEVHMPLARNRHSHWWWRTAVGAGGVVVGVLTATVGLAGGIAARESQVSGAVAACGAVWAVGFVVVWIVLWKTSLHAVRITHAEITLTNVHPEFVAALRTDRRRDEKAALREDEEEWQEEMERWERRQARRKRREEGEADPTGPPVARRYDPPPEKPRDEQAPWW